MTTILIGLPQPRADALAAELALEGVDTDVAPPSALGARLDGVDAVVVPASRTLLTPAFILACDRAAVRVIPLGEHDSRLLARYGLAGSLAPDASGWEVLAALHEAESIAPSAPATSPNRVIAVWGPAGAPGRSIVAIQSAVELARHGRRTALVDADTVAPSISLLLGLSDEAPGIAAACRRAEMGALDDAELHRLSVVVPTSGGDISVLSGINRPSRWPELTASRVHAALRACRSWAQDSVVDVSAALDADDEVTFDVSGPRRHAATTAVLAEADIVLAVVSADPVGISRFLRDHAELSRLAPGTPIRVLVNKTRPGPLGIDARSQIRRTLERFAGVSDIAFLPFDDRATDAALLHARPPSEVAPRSAFVAAVRRAAASLVPEAPVATGGSSRGSSRVVRRLLRGPAARGA
ncbi:CpaE family protein [Microbacterium sp. NPDC089695]|uniref:AAA family ATPase n=1 Tax=Microbacterium sp. NPDC089695 TaxID=3364198 RepID=UPI0038076D7B